MGGGDGEGDMGHGCFQNNFTHNYTAVCAISLLSDH